jgi:hypothetical protein
MGKKWENIVEIIGDGVMILKDEKVLSYNTELTEMLKVEPASSKKEDDVCSSFLLNTYHLFLDSVQIK